MPKKRHNSTKNNRQTLIYLAWSLAIIAVVMGIVITEYYFRYSDTDENITKKEIVAEPNKTPTILDRLDEAEKKSEEEKQQVQSVNTRLKEVLKKEALLEADLKEELSITEIPLKKEIAREEILFKKEIPTTEIPPKKEIPTTEIPPKKEIPTTEILPKKEIVAQEIPIKKAIPIKKEILSKLPEYQMSAAHEYDDPILELPPTRAIKHSVNKPKLAIIIDDVSMKSEVNAIKKLHLILTMSFMPPRKEKPASAYLASAENFYMVHLPLEALNFTKEEPKTLHVGDSEKTIAERIKDIKMLFPKVKYINNHTGSKFTSNELAMNRLIFALKENDIQFVDSRTTAQTKVPKVMKNFGLSYISRDVFLDHEMDKAYILKQIKEAIRVAKLHGTAIAIGHPHINTLQALSESKELLKQVDLVYVNRLY